MSFGPTGSPGPWRPARGPRRDGRGNSAVTARGRAAPSASALRPPLSRSRLRPGPRRLLHLRPAGLSLRLAPGSLGQCAQRQGRLARGLCHGLEVLARPACAGSGAEAPPAAPLRDLRQAAAAHRRGRPRPAALSGLARAPHPPLAGPARLLGGAEPPGGEPRRPCPEVQGRGRGALPDAAALALPGGRGRVRVQRDRGGLSGRLSRPRRRGRAPDRPTGRPRPPARRRGAAARR